MKMSTNDHLGSYVTQILASSQKAADLVRSLLAFSRKQIINPEPKNLNQIVRNVEKLLLRTIGEDIELKIILTDMELVSMVDSGQIEQVLVNLAANARDAMPDGGHLSIETSVIEIDKEYMKKYLFEEAGMYALLSVSDTGVGIDEMTRKQIFEPFFTTKEVGKGTGLGLSIAYGIIKQHGGNTDVYSEPGNGTTFMVYLPLTMKMVKEMESKLLAPPKRGTETILLAEDNESVRLLIKNVLQGYGYKVLEAVDGEDAVRVFSKNKNEIRLTLLDVVMPKKNGRKTYEEIKKITPEIKALFMSGYTSNTIHKKGILEAGLNFITKPISPHDLLRKIREVLDK